MTRIPVAERRTQLLAAAWRVLLAEGVAGATTRAICEEADMPQGVFHYCFDSRAELLAELVGGMLPREVSAALATVNRRGSAAGAVERALLAYWELVEADPQAQQVIYEITVTSLRDPVLAELTRQRYAGYPAGIARVLDELAQVRGFQWDRPVRVLARQVIALLDGLTVQFLVDRDAATARAALAAFATDLSLRTTPATEPSQL
ncbi:TetR/AcrR family transcriptional regulator [Nakamurella lactea]|uniref:TetR/AcrR family transcriptional regulator n=1 Tax=Nakamurella lactea TaxID=459515 RepID=UPI001376C794|nr:TetR family transcriptional regulator C-terminal domain-containing protein [Nakamurella lactea]